MMISFANLINMWIPAALVASALVSAVAVDPTAMPSSELEDDGRAPVPMVPLVGSSGNLRLAVGHHQRHPVYLQRIVNDYDNDDAYANDAEELETRAMMLENDDDDDERTRDWKRSMSMLRLGRSSPNKKARSMAALRLGRSIPDQTMGRAGESMNPLAPHPISRDWKRTMGMLRLGRGFISSDAAAGGDDEQDEKRSMGMLRLGRRTDKEEEEDDNARGPKEEDKRSMGMLRLGRRSSLHGNRNR